MAKKAPRRGRSKKSKPAPERRPNLELLLRFGGEITLGPVGPIQCTAVACEDRNMTVALVRQPRETLEELLDRLDSSLRWAWENEENVDEINP